LLGRAEQLSLRAPANFQSGESGKANMFRLTAVSARKLDNLLPMQTYDDEFTEALSSRDKPSWTTMWHLWTVFIPRRTITGKLERGKVWRRYDGRHWIYKRFVEFDNRDV
jgi:hypothetical protein